MRRRYIAVLASAAALGACQRDIPTQAAAGMQRATARGVTASATGGGKAQLPPGFSELGFSFSANLEADGSATGEFRQHYVSGGGSVDFHGTVTCVSFDPVNDRAWIGGVVTRNSSTNPAVLTPIHEVGKDVWFRVVDNGEGESLDDRTTVLGFEGAAGVITSAEYCARQLWAAGNANTWAVTDGNIQVRP
jgi:hypothetical protein